MTERVKPFKIPVTKPVQFVVSKLGEGTRAAADFERELMEKVIAGYKVVGLEPKSGSVVVTMAKTEDWSMPELMAEIRERLV